MAPPKRLFAILASSALILLCAAAGAQETSTTVATKNFEIVSVDGNNVVYRTDTGVKEIALPDDFQLDMNGKKIGVHDLKPGMKGTAYLTTTTTTQPVVVTDVRQAKVLAVVGNSIIVRGQEGVRKFTIDDVRDRNITILRHGEKVDLHQLHEGDVLTAMIITRLAPVVMTEAELSASLSAPPPTAAPAAPASAPASPEPTASSAGSSAPSTAPTAEAAPAATAPPAAAEAPASTAPAGGAPAESASKFPVGIVAIIVIVILVIVLWARGRKRTP
jgi:hypothetical protein